MRTCTLFTISKPWSTGLFPPKEQRHQERARSRAQPPEWAPQIWGRVLGEKDRKKVSGCVFVPMTFHARSQSPGSRAVAETQSGDLLLISGWVDVFRSCRFAGWYNGAPYLEISGHHGYPGRF